MRLTVYFPEDSPTTHEFVGNKLTVGRLGDNDVHLDDGSVSSHHAEIVERDGAAVLVDKDSTNGTYLNGEQVTGEHPLTEGDEIYFGGVRSVFMKHHADLLEADFWQGHKERIRAGHVHDVFPYDLAKRFERASRVSASTCSDCAGRSLQLPNWK